MANIKSAKKRVLVSKRQHDENVVKKTRVKNSVKKFESAVKENNVALAEQLLPETVSLIDRAFSDGVYHKNTAARKKASLAKLLNTIKK